MIRPSDQKVVFMMEVFVGLLLLLELGHQSLALSVESVGERGVGNHQEITDRELALVTEILAKVESSNYTAHIGVDLQNKTTGDRQDHASRPLLTVERGRFRETPTMKMLRTIKPMFEASRYLPERQDLIKSSVIGAFFKEVAESPLMQIVQDFMIGKGLFKSSSEFQNTTWSAWFGLYATKTDGPLTTCGFEHVFLGELTTKVHGFHSWISFEKEERDGNLNYLGYYDHLDLKELGSIVTAQFYWKNKLKNIGSIFIGTRPEFELALYTLCFFSRPNTKCPVVIHGHQFNVVSYVWYLGKLSFVKTAYPATI